MPEEAKALGNTEDMLTSGRYPERKSRESEATSQNTGVLPDGGLASHSVDASPAACLPPPKAHLPSHARPLGMRHKHQDTEERGDAKVSCPVLEQREAE